MLTVWRTLHVEFDRMPAADEDEPFGTISGESSEGLTADTLSDEVLAPWNPSGFMGGVLDPDAASAPTSIGVDANHLWLGYWEVKAAATGGGVGRVFVETDYRDDKIDNDEDDTIDEEDEAWTMAGYQAGAPFAVNTDDAEWLVDLEPPAGAAVVGAMRDYFKPAYIEVQEQSTGNQHSSVETFTRNSLGAYPGGNIDVPGDAQFWCVRVVWAYECERKSDNLNPGDAPMAAYSGDWDPNFEGVPESAPRGTATSVFGVVTAISGESADIYLEVHRDREALADLARTVTHECGHLLGLRRADPDYNPVTDDINPGQVDKGLMGFAKPLEITYQRWYELLEHHGILYDDQGMNQFSLQNIKSLRKNATD
jgi:hypothetical protein